MTNEERWTLFIGELKAYIEERHLGPSRRTSLYNQCRYFKRKLKEEALDEVKAKELEEVLGMRDLSIHTGGRKKQETVYARTGSTPVVGANNNS